MLSVFFTMLIGKFGLGLVVVATILAAFYIIKRIRGG